MRLCNILCIRKLPPAYPFLDYASNMPRRYVEDSKETVKKRYFQHRLGAPDMTRWRKHPDDYFEPTDRPWTEAADHERQMFESELNDTSKGWLRERIKRPQFDIMHKQPKEPPLIYHLYPHRSQLEPLKKLEDSEWTIFVGDKVQVMVGKDKGKSGIVSSIVPSRNWVYVRGLNLEYEGTDGHCIAQESPLDVTRQHVKLVDPFDDEPCDVEYREIDGAMVRINIANGRRLPISEAAKITYEYIDESTYKENEKDTPPELVLKQTIHFPTPLKLFEEEIMEEMKIEEKRKPAKTYWY